MFVEIIKFLIYSGIIVLISKYILVTTLRKLAENLNLKPKTIGDIAGFATSVPELLTICASSLNGLIGTSIINVLSSNVINLIQYIASIVLNKNSKILKNKALKIDLFLVLITIIIPLVMVKYNLRMKIIAVPIFVFLYYIFVKTNSNIHKLYLKNEENKLEEKIQLEEQKEGQNTRKTILYVIILAFSGILLFVVGELLGETLYVLCNSFSISQFIVGILLGVITSLPELITFFEAQKHYKKNNDNEMLGVVEATNNLLTSNILNLFIIQSIAILLLQFVAK